MFYFNYEDFNVLGSSPEILVRLNKGKVTIRPIAGTRPRGKNKFEDKKNKLDLLKDKKELAEHLMLLDLGRNDVGKVAKINSVKVTEKFKIEKYSHVMHIVSNVIGKFNNKYSLFETLLSGFPAGTVSGAPKIRAMEIIDELEKTKRKLYAGGIGYFTPNNEFDTCIALRTALIKNRKFYVQAGAGVVADSVPENEYLDRVTLALHLLQTKRPIQRFAFGDLHLAHVRQWRESRFGPILEQLNIRPHFPIWLREYPKLEEDFFSSGAQATVSALASPLLSEGWNVGDRFSPEWLDTLPDKVDRFGENGEFHTRVIPPDGPWTHLAGSI